MKTITKNAGISEKGERLKNHSVRKASCRREVSQMIRLLQLLFIKMNRVLLIMLTLIWMTTKTSVLSLAIISNLHQH